MNVECECHYFSDSVTSLPGQHTWVAASFQRVVAVGNWRGGAGGGGGVTPWQRYTIKGQSTDFYFLKVNQRHLKTLCTIKGKNQLSHQSKQGAKKNYQVERSTELVKTLWGTQLLCPVWIKMKYI